jgi:hypothetical protein
MFRVVAWMDPDGYPVFVLKCAECPWNNDEVTSWGRGEGTVTLTFAWDRAHDHWESRHRT